MLKVREIVLIALFVSAIWIVVVALQSDPSAYHQICETDQHTGKESCSAHHVPYVIAWYVGYWFDKSAAVIAAFATIAIAYFTLTLKRSTDRLWDAGDRQYKLAKEISDRQAVEIQDQIDIARIASNAAKKSADAAVAAERARFYVSIDHNFLDFIAAAARWTPDIDEKPIAASNSPMAKISFKNYGKTPGILIEVGANIEYSETPPDPVWDVKIVKDNIIAPEKVSELFDVILREQMTFGMAKKVKDGAPNIWIYGYASYDDVFGERQTHRFFQRLVCVSGGFAYVLQAYDYKHYNVSS
jgi:hypothetical protein